MTRRKTAKLHPGTSGDQVGDRSALLLTAKGGKEKKSRKKIADFLAKLESAEDQQYAQHKDYEESVKSAPGRRKKPRSSKETELAVNECLSDFWDSAWNICAERFFTDMAPTTVSNELRNCWLRIVEAEWQDDDDDETAMIKNVDIFEKLADEPPLPVAFDTWSTGTIEILPSKRRESVLDPFLRNNDGSIKKRTENVEPGECCLPYGNPYGPGGAFLKVKNAVKKICAEGTSCRKGACNCDDLEDGTVMGLSYDPTEETRTCRRVAGQKCSKDDQCFQGVKCDKGVCTWDQDTETINRVDTKKDMTLTM